MKKLLITTMVLGSTVALAACGNGFSTSDETLTGAPYAEARTVGTDGQVITRPVVRSAEPVFEQVQVK